MANVLKPKRSSTASAVPTLSDLSDGEIAVNSADKKFYMRVGGIVVDITPGAGSWVPTGGAFADAYSSTVLYYNGTGGANNIDVDTLAEGTKALVNPAAGNTNYPTQPGVTFWQIETVRGYVSTTKIQRAWAYGGRGAIATRSYNGTVWTDWAYSWTTSDNRFLADFSTASSVRAMFQSSTPNGNTFVSALPNGTATISHFRAYGSSDPNNAHYIDLYASTATVFINSAAAGTGVLRDIDFTFNGAIKATITTAGVIEAQSYFDTYGAAAGIRMWDRTVPANNFSLYGSGAVWNVSYNGGASCLELTSSGALDLDGTAAGLFLNDRTTATRWGVYSTASILRFWTGSVDLATLDTAGNFQADGTVSDGAGVLGYKNLISATNAWAVGKLNKMTAGATLGTGNAADNTYYGYNNTAGNLTITQGAGLTLRLSGTALTGNRTVAPRGFFMLYCLSTTEYIISGDVS
jgi:hypothetical protein